MNIPLAQRELALAGVALIAGIAALAGTLGGSDGEAKKLPPGVPVGKAGWYEAFAAPYAASDSKGRTACGNRLGPRTLGVAHPVLPCGVKLYLSFGDRTVLTQVIDRGPAVPGREFDVTRPLADKLGLHRLQKIRWRYAR